MLLKIRAPPGPTRTEVMQLIDIFRARVVDVSDRSMTIAVTGDAGKVRLDSCWISLPGNLHAEKGLINERLVGVYSFLSCCVRMLVSIRSVL